MPTITPASITGFFDGEGCITVQDQAGRLYIRVSLTQKHPEILRALQTGLGYGRVRLMLNPLGNRYRLKIEEKSEVHHFLTMIQPWSHTKLDQVEAALEYLEGTRPAEGLKDLLSTQKREALWNPRPVNSWAYIAGFFDAEGSIMARPTRRRPHLTITQKFPSVLRAIHDFLGYGRIYSRRTPTSEVSDLTITNREEVDHFLTNILEWCVAKRPQALVALEMTSLGRGQNPEVKARHQTLVERLKSLKK